MWRHLLEDLEVSKIHEVGVATRLSHPTLIGTFLPPSHRPSKAPDRRCDVHFQLSEVYDVDAEKATGRLVDGTESSTPSRAADRCSGGVGEGARGVEVHLLVQFGPQRSTPGADLNRLWEVRTD